MNWPAAGAATLLLPVACFLVGWAVSWLSVWIALRKVRRLGDVTWIERARLAHPARSAVLVNSVLVGVGPIGCTLTLGGPWIGSFQAAVPAAILSGVAGLLGSLLVSQRLEHQLCRGGNHGRGVALPPLFLWLGIVPIVVAGSLLPIAWDTYGLPAFVVGLGLVALNVRGMWLRVLRWLGLVHPASDRLAQIVERAAAAAGVRYRLLFELDSPNSNAMALPIGGALVFTRTLVADLDDDELAAITAHELGHMAEPWPVRLTRLTTACLPVITASALPAAIRFGPLVTLSAPVALIVGLRVFKRVARRMEERSDRLARDQAVDPNDTTYARALTKIYEANLAPAVMPGRPVHPHLYDRLIAAGVKPDFERPAPPPRDFFSRLPGLVVMLVFVFSAVAGPFLIESIRDANIPLSFRR